VQTPEQAAKSENLFRAGGWGLIAVGFAIPQLQNLALGGSAGEVGNDVGRSFGQLLLPALIAAFMTRGKSGLSKAKGTFVVGLVLVLAAGVMAVNRQSEVSTTKQFLEGALSFQSEQKAKIESVLIRLNAIDLNKHLTIESMVDKNKRALAMSDISQYKALLSERKAVIAASASGAELRVSQLPAGEARRGAEEGLVNARATNQSLFGELDVVQFEYADVLDQLFKLMESQEGKVQVDAAGQILFQSPEALTQFQKLAAESDVKAAKVNEAVGRANVAQEKAIERNEELHRQAKDILGK
jgi:hypothetical protein